MTAINYKASFLVPDFVEIQRRSFSRFLEKGIVEEFSKINPIRSEISKFELTFYPESYLIIAPEYTVTEAVLQGKTYSCKLYLPAKLFSGDRAGRINRNKANVPSQPLGSYKALEEQPLTKASTPGGPLWKNSQYNANNTQPHNGVSLKGSDELIKLGKVDEYLTPSLTERTNLAKNSRIGKAATLGQISQLIKPPIGQPGQPVTIVPRVGQFARRNLDLAVGGLTDFKRVWRSAGQVRPLDGQELWGPFSTPTSPRPWRGPDKKESRENSLLKRGETTLSWVLVGNLPLMTKRGHFIINGSPRVVINQLLRSPGVYFHERTWGFGKRKRRIVYADFVSRRGAWLRIQADKEGDIWARLKKTPKVPFALFYEGMAICERNQKEWTIADREALLELHEEVNPTKKDLSPENGQQFIVQKFKNPRTYDLSRVGRKRLNRRFGLAVASQQLTSQDLYAAFEQIQELQNDRILVDDIDHLKNRRVRPSGELLQSQFETGLYRLEKAILSKMRKPPKEVSARTLLNTKPLNAALREFFGSSPLSQYMDQTNPLAEITQKRRISSLGPGGISRETAGMAVRGIHPTHYGRICPIETPEGKNAGLVNSLTTYTRVGDGGILETPYYHVLQGQVQAGMGFQYFSAGGEENGEFRVAPGDIHLSTCKLLPPTLFPVRETGNRQEDFRHANRGAVNYMAISPIQMISVATALIPFLEHDDANRALMGSNMQRQAVPLIQPERPFVGTGLEALVVAESGHALQADLSGYISAVTGEEVVVHSYLPSMQTDTALTNDYLAVAGARAPVVSSNDKFVDCGWGRSWGQGMGEVPSPNPCAATPPRPCPQSKREKASPAVRLSASAVIFSQLRARKMSYLKYGSNARVSTHANLPREFVGRELVCGGPFPSPLSILTREEKKWGKGNLPSVEINKIESGLEAKLSWFAPIAKQDWLNTSGRPIKQQVPHSTGDWQAGVFSLNYHLQSYERSNQETCLTQTSAVSEGDWVQKGDLLADCSASKFGELALGKNILIAYLPWEGYNFEDAVVISERLVSDDVYTSIHVQKYDIEVRETRFGVEKITPQLPGISDGEKEHLDWRGIAKIGSWVKEGDILVGKVSPKSSQPLSPYERLAYDIANVEAATTEDTSLRVPKGVEGRVINCQSFEMPSITVAGLGVGGGTLPHPLSPLASRRDTRPGVRWPPLASEVVAHEPPTQSPGRVRIYLAEKRKLQVGDKVAGRHGNKGIVSTVLPRQDMPYLPDGSIVDMVLNPLGIPSRMNVGQVFECLLGLAGAQLGQQFKITPFDEIYGAEASRSLVYLKLYQARLRTNQDWLFNPRFPGKTALLDGRTGRLFDQWVTVGYAYMLKLVHLVDEKIHARSTGPYSLVTKQPLGGRSKHGGQRLGEMEVWALEGFGAAYILQEMLTSKSDDVVGREQVVEAILFKGKMSLGNPEAFKVLVRELQSLCLDVGVYAISPGRLRRETVDIGRIP
ncbi:probable DNA-directed RNA polymerase subunit beta (chloroplast) [Coccomyxa sp. Obi]|nr:probable DNA-directed RNA polymerase subunit beta [Coccomyxa sp. Obi]